MRIHPVGTFLAMSIAASAAHADPLGFVTTLGGNISNSGSYNSAGETNSLVFIDNTFQITLPGLGNGVNSDVQVSAENTNGSGHYCTVINWNSSNGKDVTVNVACFDKSGNPTLSDFTMLYQVRTVRPTGADIAFVWANQPTKASYKPDRHYSFNSIGGANKITRSGPGNYTVILGDFGTDITNVQVTAYGNVAARCQVAGWQYFSDGAHVNVRCVKAANMPSDEYYTLSYTLGGVEGIGHLNGAFAWANSTYKENYTPEKQFQFSNISQGQHLTAQHLRKPEGQYSLTVPNPGNTNFQAYLGMVTSYGSNGEYCDAGGILVESGSLQLESICYGASGFPVNTRYDGTLMVVP